MLIITHNGIFHADEVFAIAALMKWNNKSELFVNSDNFELSVVGTKNEHHATIVTRTRDNFIIEKAQSSKNVYVIDNGGIYNTEMLNFDHHQNIALSASNIMIWEHLFPEINIKLWEKMMPFMEGISDFDTNKDNTNLNWGQYNADHKFRNMSNIISGFNRDPRNEELQNSQFKKAVEFAIQVLDNEEYSAVQRIQAETIYENREILANNVAVFSEFCPIWKTKEEHNYAILPNPQGWSLNSANSSTHPLPIFEHKDLIFAHKGLFIAVFKTKEAAIEIASKL